MRKLLTVLTACLALYGVRANAADTKPLKTSAGQTQQFQPGDAVPAANGGTGQPGVAAHCVLVGAGAADMKVVCPSLTGQALVDNGPFMDPAFAPVTLCGNPCTIGPVDIEAGMGAPSMSLPEGSLWLRTDEPQIWQQGVPAGTIPRLAQGAFVVVANNTITLTSTPQIADYLIAWVWNKDTMPAGAAAWTACTATNCSKAASGSAPNYQIFYRQVDSTSFSTSQTPSTSTATNNGYGVVMWEVSGLNPSDFNSAIQAITVGQATGAGNTLTVNYTTNAPNTLTLVGVGAIEQTFNSCSGGNLTSNLFSPWTNVLRVPDISGGTQGIGGAQFTATTTSAISAATTAASCFAQPIGQTTALISLNSPGAASWSLIGPSLSTVQNGGTLLTSAAKILNCSTGTNCTVDSLGHTITLTTAALSGDCTTSGTAITCTKTNGTSFGYFATGTDAANLTGTVSVNRFNTGTGASSSTFLRGDGTWQTPAGGGNVSTTGSPANTNLTCFSAATTITNCNLSGDVTTSGSSAATLATSGVTAATYGDSTHVAQIAVDAKGRVTSASNVAISGGGGGGALTLISTQTLGAGASSVTFSSIPGSYRDLVLVVNARGDAAATAVNVNLQFNGDAGSHYDIQFLQASGSSVSAGAAVAGTSFIAVQIPAASATSGLSGGGSLEVFNYVGTTFQKTAIGSTMTMTGTTSGTQSDLMFGGNWRSTAAITSITIAPSSGNFVTGSTFQLYGRGS